MSRTRAPVYLVLIFTLTLSLFAGLLYASTATTNLSWWVVGSGGNRLSSGNTVLQSTLGQPLAYRASSGNTNLCVGFWCGTAGEYEVYLPITLNQFCGGYNNRWETEPNDGASDANGPLCSGINYYGTSDHNGPAQDSDYFYIETTKGGTINIQVTNFLSNHAQVQLYAHPVLTDTLLVSLPNQEGGNYSIVYNNAPAGRYYVRVVATAGHAVGQGPYTLRVTFP
jgi:hypothetical protein